MISKQEIQHIARLARLEFKESNLKKYQKQISVILDYLKELKKIKTDNISPCIGGTQIKNVLREDKIKESNNDTKEKLLKAAPLREKSLIKVRGIFEKK